MGGIGVIASVDPARDDDANRRRLFLHDADLHGGGVRAQQQAICALALQVKSVLSVASRVFSASKQWYSSSTSGPSATAKPILRKLRTMSSVTWVRGWSLPKVRRRPG